MTLCTPVEENFTVLAAIATRRSTAVPNLKEPGPNAAQIESLLTHAGRTPDHGKLTPWRFIVFSDAGSTRAGAIFATRYSVLHPDADPCLVAAEHNRFARAPLVIAVVTSPKDSPKIPVWEQQMSAGAVCMNLLHTANAMGFGAKWLSEWIAYDRTVLTALGLNANEQIAGYIYVGTQTQPEPERARPDIAALSQWF